MEAFILCNTSNRELLEAFILCNTSNRELLIKKDD